MFAGRTAWVFDLDGTLACAQHDFDGMKAALGLPLHLPLLEGIEALDAAGRRAAWDEVASWEWRLAADATPAPGVHALIDGLRDAGCAVGVLTRNTARTAWRTLDAIGLADRFEPAHVLGREDAAAKPAPDGILRILGSWGADVGRGVMVGDSVHDVGAGRAAAVLSVLVDPTPPPAVRDVADVVVPDLIDLTRRWRGTLT